jgi:hypothetical protein
MQIVPTNDLSFKKFAAPFLKDERKYLCNTLL